MTAPGLPNLSSIAPPIPSPNVVVTALLRVTVVRHSIDHKNKDHLWTIRKMYVIHSAAFFPPSSSSCMPFAT